MDYPPKDSLVRGSWVGASFDRNCYEMFAPKDFLDAFKLTIKDTLKGEHVYILPVAESAVGSGRICEMADFSPNALFEYLMADEKFLKDHYVFGDSKQWACLLDQDTTLFCGDKRLMRNCFDRLGGTDRVLERVLAEFGEPVSGLIEIYAERLVRGKPNHEKEE